MKIVNCVNCGAPLHKGKCPYCGSEYNGQFVSIDLDDASGKGDITINGNRFNVYLGHLETELHKIDHDFGRDINGRLVMNPSTCKRVFHFDLIEI